jgi:hypothetical protein
LIFYLEKYDITEEKVRLGNHLNYFLETLNGTEANGRKLGFITQEMGREINTMGSKSNHTEMQKLVVMMKDELEKIKEQVLNVLVIVVYQISKPFCRFKIKHLRDLQHLNAEKIKQNNNEQRKIISILCTIRFRKNHYSKTFISPTRFEFRIFDFV